MLTAVVIFGLVYALIASGKIPNSLIAIIGAMALLFMGVITGEEALKHVDLEVILLLAGMMILAHLIGRTGAFDWAALRSAQLVRGNGFWLLCLLAVMTGVASALLDNVTVVVLAVPITVALCRRLRLDPVPFLLAQVFASNIGGTATVVGDPPNIIIASIADIDFVTFMVHVAPASMLSMVALVAMLYIWFRNGVTTSEDDREEIMRQNPGEAIKDKGLLLKSGIVFALVVLGFLTHDLLGVGPAFIAVAGAGLLMLIARIDPEEVLHHVEWTTLAFFTGLFILVGGLEETGVTDRIQEWMVDVAGGNERNLSILLIWFGGAASAIVDNIPFTATMAPVVKQLPFEAPPGGTSPLWWALALGADLGGNATSVGASANVLVIGLARASGYPISFMRFMKYGLVISVVTLIIATGYMWLRYYI